MKSIIKRNKQGDCIRIACNNVIDNKEWLFCYAYVMGKGKLAGQRIIHAWNEINNCVIDQSNGNFIIIQKEEYYKVAEIKELDITKQTSKEISKLLLETGTYGGWIK